MFSEGKLKRLKNRNPMGETREPFLKCAQQLPFSEDFLCLSPRWSSQGCFVGDEAVAARCCLFPRCKLSSFSVWPWWESFPAGLGRRGFAVRNHTSSGRNTKENSDVELQPHCMGFPSIASLAPVSVELIILWP